MRALVAKSCGAAVGSAPLGASQHRRPPAWAALVAAMPESWADERGGVRVMRRGRASAVAPRPPSAIARRMS